MLTFRAVAAGAWSCRVLDPCSFSEASYVRMVIDKQGDTAAAIHLDGAIHHRMRGLMFQSELRSYYRPKVPQR